jgi:hypothetical protein
MIDPATGAIISATGGSLTLLLLRARGFTATEIPFRRFRALISNSE